MELRARKDVPVEETWDLSLIFENEEQMWAELEKTKAAVRHVADTYAGRLNTAGNIVGCLDEMEQIGISLSRIWSYTSLAVETDYTDNGLRELDERGLYTASYRLMDSGTPTYVHMKITRMLPDAHHIIIGISVMDSDFRIGRSGRR